MAKIDYRAHAFRVSLYASLITTLVVLSFRDYFLFVPFANGFTYLSFLGALSMLGWILLIAVPPMLLANKDARWSGSRKWLFIFASSLWTFATLLIKIYGLATTGQLWANYLIVYPVMFFVEWILPIYYVFLAIRLGAKTASHSSAQVEEAPATKPVYPQL